MKYPSIIDVANKAIEFSKNLAQIWLEQHMLKRNPELAKNVAETLANNRYWLSHGRRIGIEEAKKVGLKVQEIKKEDDLWKMVWEYYTRAIMHLNKIRAQKLYETSTYSMFLHIGTQPPITQQKQET